MGKRKTVKQVLVVNPPTAKTARNRRRRQARNKNKGTIARAAGMSPKKMKMWPRSKDGANFLRAALDPFSDLSLRSVGVPDSFAGDTLKHCNIMEITARPNAQGIISFTLVPSVSTPLVCTLGTFEDILIPTANVSGTANGTTRVALDAGAVRTSTAFQPGIAWPAWAEFYGGGGPQGAGPYSYKSQRITSMGMEWRYTGTTLQDQGVCTAAILDAYVIDGYEELPAFTGTNPIISTETFFVARSDVNNLVENNETSLSSQPKYVQQSLHTSEGSGGMTVMVSAEEGFIMKPTNSNSIMLPNFVKISGLGGGPGFGGNPAVGTFGATDSTGATTVCFPMIPWQNLRPVGFCFSGLPAGQPIVLKLKQRVEATVSINSAFQQFTDKSPSEDPEAMQIVADVSKGLPLMVPVTMNGFGDWWRKIFSVISSAGHIVGGIGIPMISQVAGGIGGMADILGSFADL